MKQRFYLTALFLLCISLLLGCVEKSRRLTPADKERLKMLISQTAPQPQHKLDIKFEDKLVLLGYDFDIPFVRPGEPFKVIWYWKVEKDLGDGWLLFTHIADDKNISRINADAERPIRLLHPAEEWKAGEYIRDEQELTLPLSWTSPEIRLYLGLWNGPHRMHITKGKDDGEHRVLGLKVPVKTVPNVVAYKTVNPVVIDGKIDEMDWQKASPTFPFSETRSGTKGSFHAISRLMYDDQKLYIAFEVADTFIKSTFTQKDDHLWEQDAVEVMLDPDSDGKNYFEIQVSPTGVTFDTKYASPRRPQPFGDLSWDSQIEAKVETTGTANDDKQDVNYTVEMAVPWTAFDVGSIRTPPPSTNSSWRINFFVIDTQKESTRSVGWSAPLVPDFHVPDRFGTVEFIEGVAKPKDSLPADSQNMDESSTTPDEVHPKGAPASSGLKAKKLIKTEAKKIDKKTVPAKEKASVKPKSPKKTSQ